MEEKQEVTKGGDWTTVISGQMQIFPTPNKDRSVKKDPFTPKPLDFYTPPERKPGDQVGGTGTCFVKGTKVLMEDNTQKNIEDIQIGDTVLSVNVEIKQQKLKVLNDLPGESPRLYAGAEGINKVFVNGVLTVNDGEPTESLSGVVLRSGTHTVTNPIPADC